MFNFPRHVFERFSALTQTPGAHRSPEATELLERFPNLAAIIAANAAKPIDQTESDRRAAIIERVVRQKTEELHAKNLRGHCMSAANSVMLELEAEGVPCYGLTGSLEVFSRDHPQLGVAFSAINEQTPIGHTWIVAMPYVLVDPSLSCNDFAPEISKIFPRVILERRAPIVEGHPKALISADLYDKLTEEFTLEQASSILGRDLQAFWKVFPVLRLSYPGLKLEYTPIQIVLSENPSFEILIPANSGVVAVGGSPNIESGKVNHVVLPF